MGADEELVGRDVPLRQVRRALPSGTLFVRGETGLGKTALLRAAVSGADAHLGWGTCAESGAPGFWPWTQALTGLARAVGRERALAAAGPDRGLLSALVPALGEPSTQQTDRDRLLLLDAAVSWLHALAADRSCVVVLDDLQWADDSSLALLEQLVSRPRTTSLALLCAYRPDEATPQLARVASQSEQLALTGLARPAVAELLTRSLGVPASEDLVDRVYARAAGHPLFTRELALADGVLPDAVQQAVARRVGRLPATTQDVLTTAALIGNALLPDVLSDVHGDRALVEEAVDVAVGAGIIVRGDPQRFAHDVFREALAHAIPTPTRALRHAAVAAALDERAARGGEVSASEVARHHRCGLPHGDVQRAAHWALLAVSEDLQALALGEAAGHPRRLRGAVAAAGLALPDALQTELLLAEADALARSGRPSDARGLLRAARSLATRGGDAERQARTALAAAALGAQFATRRDELVSELEEALAVVTDVGLRAQLTAVLARELQHSVPEQRARSGPLTEEALEMARGTDDPAVVRACLLARHDVLWTPGAHGHRAAVAEELVDLLRGRGEPRWLAQALLLQANALLESGDPGFAPVLSEALALHEETDDRYTVLTRQACLALMHGELDAAEHLIAQAAELGGRQREPDTENVRMSQRLELVRARGDASELAAFADEAVAHWTGAPVHAHSVAAGFRARAGDLGAARRELDVVQALGSWRSDRSYLWSVYVRELATAAVALEDVAVCAALLEDLTPLTGACGVNGAVIAFAGCHSRTAGMLAAALGDEAGARALLAEADGVETRLGVLVPTPSALSLLRRQGRSWLVAYEGLSASVPHGKGMQDLATLLARPHRDVHVLDLMQSGLVTDAAGPALDRPAVASLRARLEALSAQRRTAEESGDEQHLLRVESEHEALLAELGRATALGGRSRGLGASTTERARKAVAGRLRDAVRRIDEVLPGLATHLSQTLVTGVRCRYAGDVRWQVET